MAAERSSNTQWFTDTGATNHITSDLNNLHLRSTYQGSDQVFVGNGESIPIANTSTSYVHPSTSPNTSLILKDILHVPSISKNLLSVHNLQPIIIVLSLFNLTIFM